MIDLLNLSAILGTVGSIWAGRESLVGGIVGRRRAILVGVAALCYGMAIASFCVLNGFWDPRTQVFMVGIPVQVGGHRLCEIYAQRMGESGQADVDPQPRCGRLDSAHSSGMRQGS